MLEQNILVFQDQGNFLISKHLFVKRTAFLERITENDKRKAAANAQRKKDGGKTPLLSTKRLNA